MTYDTIKLKSPSMDSSLVNRIEQQCVLKSGEHLGTGGNFYEILTAEFLGSFVAVDPGWVSSPDDVFFWLDGTWCFRHEFMDLAGHMSDDFRILHEGDCGWCAVTEEGLSVLSLPCSSVAK